MVGLLFFQYRFIVVPSRPLLFYYLSQARCACSIFWRQLSYSGQFTIQRASPEICWRCGKTSLLENIISAAKILATKSDSRTLAEPWQSCQRWNMAVYFICYQLQQDHYYYEPISILLETPRLIESVVWNYTVDKRYDRDKQVGDKIRMHACTKRQDIQGTSCGGSERSQFGAGNIEATGTFGNRQSKCQYTQYQPLYTLLYYRKIGAELNKQNLHPSHLAPCLPRNYSTPRRSRE